MTDTSKADTFILGWEIPPSKTPPFDPEVLKDVIAKLQEHKDDVEEAVIRRGVSASWAASNNMAKALKENGVRLRTHKADDGKHIVYARYAPEAPKRAKTAA